MLTRVPEPEVMDELEEVQAYDVMDHSFVNRLFIDDLAQITDLSQPLTILDAGTGTGLIPLAMIERFPQLQIRAIDQSAPMIDQANCHLAKCDSRDKLCFAVENACDLPCPDSQFDLVISNSLVHHLPDPLPFFQEACRVLKPGGKLFLRDLARPDFEATLESLVEMHAGTEGPVQRQLFRQSLWAAFRCEEIEAMLRQCENLQFQIAMTSDRHWTVTGQRAAG